MPVVAVRVVVEESYFDAIVRQFIADNPPAVDPRCLTGHGKYLLAHTYIPIK